MKILYLGLSAGNQNGLTDAFRNNSTEYRDLNCGDKQFNAKAIQIINEFEPDVVFIQIQTANIINQHTLEHLSNSKAFVINWTGDVRHPIPEWYKQAGEWVDLTCFSNMNDVEAFRGMGYQSAYLEIGYDPEIYTPNGGKKVTRDIVFLGNNYGDGYFPESKFRREMVGFLQYHYPHDFALYGSGWPLCNGNFNHSQREEAELYRGAKIAINLSHYNYKRYNSDRILRIMGTGVPLCLTRDYPDLKMDYSPGINVATWETLDELKANIDFYLKHEDLRREIVLKGNELVKEKFTFDKMVKNIINLAL